MNRRRIILSLAGLSVVSFAGGWAFNQRREIATSEAVTPDRLVRPHSPSFGPLTARVTIVEFFDPSCEACRAFFPIVKQILASRPAAIRLVLRYAAFHDGSEEVVRLLEAARLQTVFAPVLDAVIEQQPRWAIHGAPNLEEAWAAAKSAGLDVSRARQDMTRPEISHAINLDREDVEVLKIQRTPTFFVNGRLLTDLSPSNLASVVQDGLDGKA